MDILNLLKISFVFVNQVLFNHILNNLELSSLHFIQDSHVETHLV